MELVRYLGAPGMEIRIRMSDGETIRAYEEYRKEEDTRKVREFLSNMPEGYGPSVMSEVQLSVLVGTYRRLVEEKVDEISKECFKEAFAKLFGCYKEREVSMLIAKEEYGIDYSGKDDRNQKTDGPEHSGYGKEV